MSFINIEACFFYTGDSTLLDSDGLNLLIHSNIFRLCCPYEWTFVPGMRGRKGTSKPSRPVAARKMRTSQAEGRHSSSVVRFALHIHGCMNGSEQCIQSHR